MEEIHKIFSRSNRKLTVTFTDVVTINGTNTLCQRFEL